MASKIEIIRRTNAARRKLEEALAVLSDALGVAVVDVRGITFRRDPDYERMLQWQALAQWAQALADAVGDLLEPQGALGFGLKEMLFVLSNLPKAKLVALATEYGFEVAAGDTREDIARRMVAAMYPPVDESEAVG